jgi:hypothetical protein
MAVHGPLLYSSWELKAPEEACSPPRRTTSSSKQKIYELFPYSELCSVRMDPPRHHFDAKSELTF